MRNTLPPNDKPGKAARAPKGPKSCLNVPIYGHRDPRGPDNNLRVWVDAEDRLHLRLEKTSRCYKFAEVVNAASFVEIIAV